MTVKQAFFVAVVVLSAQLALACTNFLVTKGASKDGSTMISYAADSHTMYGTLAFYPAADHPAGSWREIYDWESHEYLGKIPEIAHTYNVVGNMNEHQVAIGETTYGGIEELCHQSGAIIDYGSLIYIALQRSKTAREAIDVMTSLVAKYGYASEGESFSIADPTEVWILEMIGKGDGELGAVWVARKVPDGYVAAHANQARIRTFPLNDPNNTLFAEDVVDFAKSKGYYPQSGSAEDFSFSDVYDKVTFGGARFCEARVWSFFNAVSDGMDEYLDYAKGYDLTHRMPLWVTPKAPVSLNDTMNCMRDHFEGTWLDFRGDVGAQAYNMPYRWRPLTWKQGGQDYLNERSVGTQQTAWSYVAHMRSWLPDPIGGILWFGVDDTASTVYMPVYCGSTRIPLSWAEGTGGLMDFTLDSAFWVFNLVSNFAYSRYEQIHPEVFATIVEYEERYFNESAVIDQQASTLYAKDPAAAIEVVTKYTETTGQTLAKEWLTFWQYLFMKYMDGNVKYPDPKHKVPKVEWPGYPDAWLARIVAETGDHYLMRGPDGLAADRKMRFVQALTCPPPLC